MATIKSFTDISQSKKLAEILPLESADMCYLSDESLFPKINYNGMVFFNSEEEKPSTIIPCWSLASLLELLPKRLEIIDNVYKLSVYLYGLYYWNISNGNLCFESKDKDNLVDACYEMIEKLHKLNLL